VIFSPNSRRHSIPIPWTPCLSRWGWIEADSQIGGKTVYRASRDLIKSRLPFCRIEPRVVSVERIPRDKQQNCFLNAHGNEKVDVLGSGTMTNELVSGWIVFPMDDEQKSTEINQHWWNYDPVAGRHFDTTIFDEAVSALKVDYVCDAEFKNDIMRRFSDIASNVGKDLLYAEGQWHVIEFAEDGSPEIDPIADLSSDNVMYFK
jgi:hypothetical protein